MTHEAMKVPKKWEIFCRVVDNYGDIGVCWRLACALVVEHHVDIRLWVDDWVVLSRICPQVSKDGDIITGVELRRWTDTFQYENDVDVVIEAFACELPDFVVQAMAGRSPSPLWINLEYLSAEDWIEDCHGMSSPHPDNGLEKFFFFPGFTPGTGGLIRETALAGRQKAAPSRSDWLRARGIEPPSGDTLVLSLFSYEQPAIGELLAEWQAGPASVLLLVPEGRVLSSVNAALGSQITCATSPKAVGRLSMVVLPFTSQDDFDTLLLQCDINIVRGEDSFVRAQWAGQPMLWHIYPQDGDAHLKKLEAWLRRYCYGLDPTSADALRAFWLAWNRGSGLAAAWPGFYAALPELKRWARHWCGALSTQTGLITRLWQFCQQKHLKIR